MNLTFATLVIAPNLFLAGVVFAVEADDPNDLDIQEPEFVCGEDSTTGCLGSDWFAPDNASEIDWMYEYFWRPGQRENFGLKGYGDACTYDTDCQQENGNKTTCVAGGCGNGITKCCQ